MARRRRIIGVILASLLGCGGDDRALPVPYARITASTSRVHVLCRGDYCSVQLMLGGTGEIRIGVAADTTDHHHAERHAVVANVRDVRIDTGDGDDDVIAYGLSFQGLRNLTIASGAGRDAVELIFSSPARALSIASGDGDDTIVTDAVGGTATTIDGGAGSDDVTFAYFGAAPVTVSGGDGDDVIAIRGFESPGTLTVDAGSGDDRVRVDDFCCPRDARIDGGAGEDQLEPVGAILGPGFSAVGFERP